MKILWHSVAPWAPTGYGQQTKRFLPRIAELGHDVALSAYYGLGGSVHELDAIFEPHGLKVYPPYNKSYGTDVIVTNALDWFGAENDKSIREASTKGLIITLGDVWTFEAPLLEQMSIAAWVPVDHLGVPKIVQSWFRRMSAVPIAMSRFGERVLGEAGLPALYVPHGIDTDVFEPGDRTAAREALGFPESAFVVGMVANNIGRDGNRKAFAEQIIAFRELRRKHSDAVFYVHADVDADAGMNLRQFLADNLPAGSYSFTDPGAYRRGLTPEGVAQIHRALDVLSNTSYGEGFGVPIIEAQACGTPVVVTDATAMSELCGAGWAVGYEPMWHESQGGWAAKPVISEITEAYEEAYDKAASLRGQAWAFAQDYDSDVVTQRYWKPVLDELEIALAARRESLDQVEALAPKRRSREAIVESDGFLWIDRGDSSDDWVVKEQHESWLRPIFDREVPEGGVVLDVGAHVGRWSLRLAERAERVIAVEASPSTATTLRRHLALNDVRNVDVLEVAAWDSETTLRLTDPNDRTDGGGARTVEDGPGVHVKALPLDVVLPELDRLDLVKLDVEGADLHALRGLRATLEWHRPTLLIECHDIYGYYDRADLDALIDDLGYDSEVCASIPSNWQPGVGLIDEYRDGDYLLCRPRGE